MSFINDVYGDNMTSMFNDYEGEYRDMGPTINQANIDRNKAYQGSNAWAGFGAAGVASDMMQYQNTVDQYEHQSNALLDKAQNYRFQANRIELAAQGAQVQTELNVLNMQQEFNNTQEQQMVKLAIQGRSGGSINAIVRNDQENLAWDKEMMELSGMIKQQNYGLDIASLNVDEARTKRSAAETKLQGFNEAPMALLNTVQNFGMLV